MIAIPPQSASRHSYGAAVMAAHLRIVVQCGTTCPNDLRTHIHIAVQRWFANALRALYRTEPHMEEQMLVLLRQAISRSIAPPPQGDDALSDRLHAYAHILGILDTRRTLTKTEQRDAHELVACLEALRNAGGSDEYSEYMAESHADLDALASQIRDKE